MTDLDMDALLAEKRREALDQLKAACMVLADMLRTKGYGNAEVAYRVSAKAGETWLHIDPNHEGLLWTFRRGDQSFEEAVAYIQGLPIAVNSENCAAWFQPEAIST